VAGGVAGRSEHRKKKKKWQLPPGNHRLFDGGEKGNLVGILSRNRSRALPAAPVGRGPVRLRLPALTGAVTHISCTPSGSRFPCLLVFMRLLKIREPPPQNLSDAPLATGKIHRSSSSPESLSERAMARGRSTTCGVALPAWSRQWSGMPRRLLPQGTT